MSEINIFLWRVDRKCRQDILQIWTNSQQKNKSLLLSWKKNDMSLVEVEEANPVMASAPIAPYNSSPLGNSSSPNVSESCVQTCCNCAVLLSFDCNKLFLIFPLCFTKLHYPVSVQCCCRRVRLSFSAWINNALHWYQ